MFFSILGAIAEFEASLLSERTKDGLEAAPMLDRPETRSHLQVRSCVRMGDMQHKPDQVITEIADRIRQVVEADQRVRFAYLFGSMSRGDDRPESDVDLAVLTRPRGTLLDDARLHDEWLPPSVVTTSICSCWTRHHCGCSTGSSRVMSCSAGTSPSASPSGSGSRRSSSTSAPTTTATCGRCANGPVEER